MQQKNLLRQQLSFLLDELEEWSFQSYSLSAGVELSKRQTSGTSQRSDQIIKKERSGKLYYYIHGTVQMISLKEGWRSPDVLGWENLPPQDWIVILDSLSLAWNQSRFVEEFGPEKVRLNAALMNFHSAFSSLSGMNLDSVTVATDPINQLCLHAYREDIRLIGKESILFETEAKMPNSLNDPSHWGFLAWKYTNFGNGKQDYGRNIQTISVVSGGNRSDGIVQVDNDGLNIEKKKRKASTLIDSDSAAAVTPHKEIISVRDRKRLSTRAIRARGR